MADIRKSLNEVFKNSKIFTESETTELNEKTWDDIKGAWAKGKEIGKDPIAAVTKNLRDKIGDKIFNKKEEPKKVAGTGTHEKPKSVAPKAPVAATPAATPAPAKAVAPTPAAVPTPAAPPVASAPVAPQPANQLVPKQSTKSSAVLNPKGIELQGVEDPNQKEKKIINPLKTLLKDKNREFVNAFNKIKEKNGITSKNSTDEISTKDPADITRKTIIRNIFAIKFYKDAYLNLLENLRNLNIISEEKIDSGVFQQAILNSIEKSKQKHIRRYAANLKKINNLSKNENDVKLGMKKGDAAFKRDMNNLYKNNRDKFTMLNMQESVKIDGFFSESEFVEAPQPQPAEDPKKEDNNIRANDYVWWLDETELENIFKDPKKRSRLTYEKQPIEFEDTGNGKLVNGTSAQVKFLKGPKAGESEKIDIRNIDVPQDLAKSLISFGKVLSNTEDIDKLIQDKQNELKSPGITAPDISTIQKEIADLEKKKEKLGKAGSVAKLQKFVAKDPNNLEKTLSSGKTKITPDPANKVLEVPVRDLVKLNKNGKSKLLAIIGHASIILHSLLTMFSPSTLHKFMSWVDTSLADLAKKFGDLAGSKSQTNFGPNAN